MLFLQFIFVKVCESMQNRGCYGPLKVTENRGGVDAVAKTRMFYVLKQNGYKCKKNRHLTVSEYHSYDQLFLRAPSQRWSSRQLWKVTTKLPQWWCPPARPTWNTSWQPGLLYVLTLSSMKGIHHTIVHLNIILSFSLLVRISHQNLLRVAFINEVIGWRMIPKSYSTQTHLSNISNSLNLVQGLVQN